MGVTKMDVAGKEDLSVRGLPRDQVVSGVGWSVRLLIEKKGGGRGEAGTLFADLYMYPQRCAVHLAIRNATANR